MVLIVASGALALLGVVHWWPDAQRVDHLRGLVPVVDGGIEVVHGELTQVRTACVKTGASDGPSCGDSRARLLDGASAGRTVAVTLTPDVVATGLAPGDHVLLFDTSAAAGGAAAAAGSGSGAGSAFTFYRDDRGGSLLWLAILFAVAVALVAWRRGVMALVSLGFAGVVVVGFLLPALLSGRPAVPVTLASCVLILIVMLYATHGVSMRTSVALVGALLGVGLSTVFAWFAVIGSRLAGLGDESAGLLTFNVSWIAVQQLVVASVILAGLGTLNDVTITQVSALWELRDASPDASRRRLFTRAMRIGRDHVASTVYTVVFAYLGTSLVLLVAVQLYGGTSVDFLTAENVAEEIVRTLVGGIALVLAMPVTTAIGALVVASGPAARGADPVDPVAAPQYRRTAPPTRRQPDFIDPFRRLPQHPWDAD